LINKLYFIYIFFLSIYIIMSLGFDTEYNARLRKRLQDFNNPVEANKTQPEMFYRQSQSDFILPYSKPAYPTLSLALKAERQIGEAQGQDEMEGEGLGSFVKSVGKSVTKGAKKVAKGAKKVAKSKVGKAVGKVAKKGVSKALDEAVKVSGEVGSAGGVALATAIGQPELAPAFALAGKEGAEALAPVARKAIKKKTGLGMNNKRKPSAWIQHIQKYAKEHNVPYKQAMKDAKATYKK
jgi:hypothetical protein